MDLECLPSDISRGLEQLYALRVSAWGVGIFPRTCVLVPGAWNKMYDGVQRQHGVPERLTGRLANSYCPTPADEFTTSTVEQHIHVQQSDRLLV